MTQQQWKIYDLIKSSVFISNLELCEKLGVSIDEDSVKRNLSRKSLDIQKEIESINESSLVDKPILWDAKSNYWIARSQEDIEQFVNRIYRKPALKKLWRCYNLLNKGKKNGQGKVFSNDLRPINECPYAKEFIDSFATDLQIEEEINLLKGENETIEMDDNKYINGGYEKQKQNIKRIEELEKWKKDKFD